MGAARDPCPICGSGMPPERFELREMLFGSREPFEYLLCPTCGTMRIASAPTDLSSHYPLEYYTGYTGQPPVQATRKRRDLRGMTAVAAWAVEEEYLFGRRRRLANLLRRYAPPIPAEVARWRDFARRTNLRSFRDPVLDVGCGRNPRQLFEMRAAGFRWLLGVDPYLDGDSVVDGIHLRRCSIDQVSGSFQLITFNHSFEHVPDPARTLSEAAARLRAGGTVMIRTPVMGGWFWDRFRTNWWELDPPRHLFIFSLRGLDLLAQRVGLSRVVTIWESSAVELIASDQIERGIAWRAPESYQTNPPAGYDEATIASFKSIAADLNREGRAGRAALYYRRADSGPAPRWS